MSEYLVPTLLAPFATLEDPRIDRTKHHHLLDIIFIALCAVVSGAQRLRRDGKVQQEQARLVGKISLVASWHPVS